MEPRGRHALLAVALSSLALPSLARAQDYAGAWRVTRDEVNVTVSDWGAGCGPRPTSRQNGTGREVTIRAEGDDLVISGGRTNRTNRCWSDNRDVALTSASHPSPARWVVTCGTPVNFGLGEQGTYTLSAEGPNRLRFRDETRYAWTIQGATCRATSVLERDYERANPVDAGLPPPPPPPPPPTTTTTTRPPPPPPPPPAPSRCATPGPATSLLVQPSRRSTTAGERVCFRARLVDASRCEAQGPAISWALRRTAGSGEGALDHNCFVTAASAAEGEFELTATAGDFTGRATVAVVSVDRYRDLVAAHLEDPDAGAAVEIDDRPRVGAVAVSAPAPHPRSPLPWVLLGLSALLAAAGAVVLARRRAAQNALAAQPPEAPLTTTSLRPLRTSPQSAQPDAARVRHDAVPLSARDLPLGAMPPTPPPPPVTAAAPVVPSAPPAPMTARSCPRCGTHYVTDLAFCPQDGAPLTTAGAEATLPAPPKPPVAAAPAQPAPPRSAEPQPDGVCPTCGRRYPAPTVFCGEDGAILMRPSS